MVSKGKKKRFRKKQPCQCHRKESHRLQWAVPEKHHQLCTGGQTKNWTHGLRGEKGKTTRNSEADTEYQHINHRAVVLKTQMAEGRSPTTQNWISGPSLHRCSALVAESLQTSPRRFCRGETQIPRGNTQSCRNPTHSPKKHSWRNYQHLQYAEFWESLLYFVFIWGSWKASSLQPQARQKTAISNGKREADFLGKPCTSQSLDRKTREQGRRAAHSL